MVPVLIIHLCYMFVCVCGKSVPDMSLFAVAYRYGPKLQYRGFMWMIQTINYELDILKLWCIKIQAF